MFFPILLLAAGCNAPGLAKIDDAMTQVEPGYHVTLVAEGLSEECGSAFPPSLTSALHWLAGVAPAMQKMAAPKAIDGDPTLWTKACPAGPREFIASMRDKHRAEAWDACRFDAKTFATRAEYVAATGQPELAAMVLAALREAKVDEKRARIYARAIAGIANGEIPLPKPTPTLRPFMSVPAPEPASRSGRH